MQTERSLRTIDNLRSGNLLTLIKKSNDLSLNSKLKTKSLENSTDLYSISNLLSPSESQNIIQNALQNYGFSSINYPKSSRQADRLSILDPTLSDLIWKRLCALPNFIANLSAIKPFGFNTEGIWKASGLNPCFRISRYIGPSIGFLPHFDSPYCPSIHERSALSLVIYLNDDMDGGQTCFYTLPPENPANTNDVLPGLSFNEEIELHGGLNNYHKVSVKPKTGKGVLFLHDTIHAGCPVKSGIKYVMRTDVVFIHSSSSSAPRILFGNEYIQCLELFREAQNRELEGDLEKASELYERALSIRRAQGRPQTFSTHTFDLLNLNNDIWSIILSYLTFEDLHRIQLISRKTRAIVNLFKSRIWFQAASKYNLTPPSNVESPPLSDKELCLQIKKKFIPSLISRHGSSCSFIFSDKKFLEKYLEASIRVLAIYTVFLFGTPQKSRTFTVHYDPVQGTVVQCSKDWLLTCAFYELPLMGSFFHLHHCDDLYQIEKLSEESGDDTEDNENIIEENEEKNEEKLSKKRKKNSDDEEDQPENTKKKKKKNNNSSNSSSSSDEYQLDPINPDILMKHFQKSIDKRYLSRHYFSNQPPTTPNNNSPLVNPENHLDLFMYLCSREDKRIYLESIDTKPPIGPFYSRVLTEIEKKRDEQCMCGRTNYYETDTKLMNNLICDFSKQKLVVEEQGVNNWRVNINPIVGIGGFQHAGSYCDCRQYDTGTTIKFGGKKELGYIEIKREKNCSFKSTWYTVNLL